jgi:hypothetical protein
MDKNERGFSPLLFLPKDDAKLQNKCVDRANSSTELIFVILTAMTKKITVFWYVMLCSRVEDH